MIAVVDRAERDVAPELGVPLHVSINVSSKSGFIMYHGYVDIELTVQCLEVSQDQKEGEGG